MRTAACFEEKDSRYDTTRMERQAMRKTDKVSKRGRKKIFEALPKPKTFLEHEACCTSVGTRMEWSGQSGCAINSVGKQCSASINGRYKRLLQKFWEAFSLGFAFDEVDRFQKYAVLRQVDFVKVPHSALYGSLENIMGMKNKLQKDMSQLYWPSTLAASTCSAHINRR